MKRKNIKDVFTLLLLTVVVGILGLISQEKKNSKESLAGGFIPQAYADVPSTSTPTPPPPDACLCEGCEGGSSADC